MAFNSGIDQYKELGALMYFGSDENLAGQAAGQRIAAAGGKHVLCVIQAAGSVALEARCAGVKKGVAEHREHPGQRRRRLGGDVSPLQAKLAQDKSIDYIVTLGAPIALDALKAMDAGGQQGQARHLRPQRDAAQAIKDGKIQFSIDQQPYVQGYLAVHVALPEQEERQRHRRRQGRADRPVLRRQHQHRHHPPVRQEQHPLVPSGGRLVVGAASWPIPCRDRSHP